MAVGKGLFILSSTVVVVAAVVGYDYWRRGKKPKEEDHKSKAEKGTRRLSPAREPKLSEGTTSNPKQRILSRGTITIAHASVTGTCSSLAKRLYDALDARESFGECTIQLGPVEEWDWWDEFLNNEENQDTSKSSPPVVIYILPTHSRGEWPDSALSLKTSLLDLKNDWRVEKHPLKQTGIRVAAFGMGSSAYGDGTMGKPARESWIMARKLGAKSIGSVGVGDDSVGDHNVVFDEWMRDLIRRIDSLLGPAQGSPCECNGSSPNKKSESCCCQTNSPPNVVSVHGENEYDSDEELEEGEPEVIDLEDMGNSMQESKNPGLEPTEMVTPTQAMALKKEGYKLIGTHSAVKLCRWTKHQLRGRGGCYKHTHYGITSYQCMEVTPSLACANKCVFCWRHHKNPVGKEWRWKTDDPHFIVDEAVKTHVKMIKEARGIPGVRVDRWQAAHTVRHCALSLVGEPIMYPRINELLGDLHSRKISTFLVTNGQHPQAIANLLPITQLYVSVDAPTQESLVEIDRPLFIDAWDRLKQSLSCLKAKGQRTVARLTVVKGWNSNELHGYAKLIALGHCSLVEVKGVTFCGKSDASNLNMSNTPWHHEVVSMTKSLQKELANLTAEGGENAPPEYGLACEHKHSCSVLLARVDQFAVDDPVSGERRWRTWIDYDKFHELVTRSAEDPSFTFSVEDYTADTPSWALFGAEEEGFDPTDERHRKKKKHPKYTRFDEQGIPTHDQDGRELSSGEIDRLAAAMERRRKEIGSSATITELQGGAKEVKDASLMFRGMVVVK